MIFSEIYLAVSVVLVSYVFFRILIELLFAIERAKIVGLSVML